MQNPCNKHEQAKAELAQLRLAIPEHLRRRIAELERFIAQYEAFSVDAPRGGEDPPERKEEAPPPAPAPKQQWVGATRPQGGYRDKNGAPILGIHLVRRSCLSVGSGVSFTVDDIVKMVNENHGVDLWRPSAVAMLNEICSRGIITRIAAGVFVTGDTAPIVPLSESTAPHTPPATTPRRRPKKKHMQRTYRDEAGNVVRASDLVFTAIDNFDGRREFNSDDVVAWIKRESGVRVYRPTAANAMVTLCKEGIIARTRKGVYAKIPSGAQSHSNQLTLVGAGSALEGEQ